MSSDGSKRRLIEPNGWGSAWSPDGKEIAYTIYDQRGAVLRVYDVAKGKLRDVEHKQYSCIYWGLTWSPDSKWICFKANQRDGGCEIAAISAEGENRGFKVLVPKSDFAKIGSCDHIMSWGGTGEQGADSVGRMTSHSHDVTSVETWQKTWQKKTTEECQIVQKNAGHADAENPAKQGKTRGFRGSESHPN